MPVPTHAVVYVAFPLDPADSLEPCSKMPELRNRLHGRESKNEGMESDRVLSVCICRMHMTKYDINLLSLRHTIKM